MDTHYILVKVETTDLERVVLAIDAALDGDDIHQIVGKALVCDVNNLHVQWVLDGADLMPTRTETRSV